MSFKGIIRGDPDTESLKNYLFKFGRAGFPHKLFIFLYLTNAYLLVHKFPTRSNVFLEHLQKFFDFTLFLILKNAYPLIIDNYACFFQTLIQNMDFLIGRNKYINV